MASLDSPKCLHIWYTKKKDKFDDMFGRRVRTFGGFYVWVYLETSAFSSIGPQAPPIAANGIVPQVGRSDDQDARIISDLLSINAT